MTQIDSIRPPKAALAPQKPPAVSAGPPPQPPAPAALGEKLLAEFDRAWQKAHAETEKRIRTLRPEARGMIELQSTVQQLGVGSQLLAQTADAACGTIRRVQQMGAG